MDDLRQKLQEELDTVDWRALRTQLRRDNVILIAPELDLVEVAWCVAKDRSAAVADWVAAGQLRKPGLAELASWERQLEKPFRVLIVAPYVLIQQG
jgi:hypothetical protein